MAATAPTSTYDPTRWLLRTLIDGKRHNAQSLLIRASHAGYRALDIRIAARHPAIRHWDGWQDGQRVIWWQLQRSESEVH